MSYMSSSFGEDHNVEGRYLLLSQTSGVIKASQDVVTKVQCRLSSFKSRMVHSEIP